VAQTVLDREPSVSGGVGSIHRLKKEVAEVELLELFRR
jgi:hypothetical protein